MIDYLAGLGVWNWFILGAVLLGIEIIAPGGSRLPESAGGVNASESEAGVVSDAPATGARRSAHAPSAAGTQG